MVEKILPYLKRWAHDIYVEPFGGGASMLFAKDPVGVEVYNDLDSGLFHFFKILSDPRDFARFYRRVQPILLSREFYNECLAKWEDTDDLIDRAVKWFVVARQNFSGHFGQGWSFSVTSSSRGMSQAVSSWLTIIDMLPEIYERIRRTQIEHEDWRTILERYDTPKTLFYCDPPYIADTRKSGGYAHEMNTEDHEQLIDSIQRIQGAAVLSGYSNPIYAALEWERIDYQTACHAAGRTRATGLQGKGSVLEKQPRTESLWVHPRITETNQQLTLF